MVSGASLVAQWLRTCLTMQGTRVRALVREDPTCRGATGPVSHNYWACASGACARNKRGRDSERPAHRDEEWSLLAATRESPRTETKTQHSQKSINKYLKKKKNGIWPNPLQNWYGRCGRLHYPKTATAISPIPHALPQCGLATPRIKRWGPGPLPLNLGGLVTASTNRVWQNWLWTPPQGLVRRSHAASTWLSWDAHLGGSWLLREKSAPQRLPHWRGHLEQPTAINWQPHECAILDGQPSHAFRWLHSQPAVTLTKWETPIKSCPVKPFHNSWPTK